MDANRLNNVDLQVLISLSAIIANQSIITNITNAKTRKNKTTMLNIKTKSLKNE